MKKTLLLFAFLGMFSFMAQAQKSCAKSCAKKCTKTAAAAKGADDTVVAKAASMDASIERRQCADSGKVSYFRKATCPASGKVSFAEVNFDQASAKFVNVSPSAGSDNMESSTEGAKAGKACTKAEMKACCSGGGDKPACCSKKASKKAMKREAKATKVSLPQN